MDKNTKHIRAHWFQRRAADTCMRSYVSPRKRAQRTFELLNLGIKDPLPWKAHGVKPEEVGLNDCTARVEVTEDIREWECS